MQHNFHERDSLLIPLIELLADAAPLPSAD
jgi:hypothetical protein